MSVRSPTAIIGCLLDVSGSMREALETGRSDERAVERLRAVLCASLRLARAEQGLNPHALMFVGVFGLNHGAGCPPGVDLCGVVDALLGTRESDPLKTGHELLVALANENNLAHVTRYIRTKLTEHEARIVNAYLRRHPERKAEFISAIPGPEQVRNLRTGSQVGGAASGIVAGMVVAGPVGAAVGGLLACLAADKGADVVENHAVDQSDGMRLARRICGEWLLDFANLTPRPVADVVNLLERLQGHTEAGSRTQEREPGEGTLLDTLRTYMYGYTPMRDALSRSLAAFREHPGVEQRVLVLVSDGVSTDGDPLPLALELQQANVTIAAVYLTGDQTGPHRRLYDRPADGWTAGEHALFSMAARIAGATHPVPVLTSMGWGVPSSGECALYATVSSSAVLDEFCSLLLSARFGSADALLDVIGRVRLDAYVDDEHIRTRSNPSDQGQSRSCYAHATAAVLHMALRRIVGREGGYPSIEEIRTRLLERFPPKPGGWTTGEVLKAATTLYRPLRFRKVDEEGARQAVLQRRPVLATFHLSRSGWDTFSRHFKTASTRSSVLTRDNMASHRSSPRDGGHAVVLIGCAPRSLTFLNSWGRHWGNNGSFSVEDHTVLELEAASMTFYDVYWLAGELTAAERRAYDVTVDEAVRARAVQHPSILELEARCPRCRVNAPIADFKGNVYRALCPGCRESFAPQPGHLVQALYARAGLGEAT
ncbi:Uncharacterized protein TPAR_02794 [Tolypocladium paradoxum]|uniref:VWFA domain-containing protein n=1 Tax=Tolypocladium paradoxum TaxID=94208 RepID=A0A2S4L3J8_9HYPO|nr:Uncharacterized protein TPAR_02794 [Tolypocladium paradoxum]